MLIVGQHRMIRGAQEVAVPDSRKRQQDRQVAVQGCAAEVLVKPVRTGQKLGEIFPADRHGQDKAHGRADRVPSADPIPQVQPTLGRHPESIHRPVIRGHRHELRRNRGRSAPLQQPIANPSCVGQCFRSRERLGTNHEQRRFGIHAPHDTGQLNSVDV